MQAGDARHQETSPPLHKTVGLGGGVEAESFPTEGWGGNPEGAAANLTKQQQTPKLTGVNLFASRALYSSG